VAHTTAGWSGEACDVGNHRLGHLCCHEISSKLFVIAADLSYENDDFGVRVVLEELQTLDEAEAVHWVAAYANTR